MADTGGGRRPIELIRQQKQANRHAMLDAAAALFAASGFAGTTMEAVAARSGMSVQSVYFAFGTKAALLRAAIERLTPPPSTRPVDRDPDRVLKALVEERVRGLDATGALVLAAAAAAPGEPAVADVSAWQQSLRAQSASDLVSQLRSRRPLATGVTARRASDVVYGLLSPHLHAALVQERGWTSRRYAAWVGDAIARALWG